MASHIVKLNLSFESMMDTLEAYNIVYFSRYQSMEVRAGLVQALGGASVGVGRSMKPGWKRAIRFDELIYYVYIPTGRAAAAKLQL